MIGEFAEKLENDGFRLKHTEGTEPSFSVVPLHNGGETSFEMLHSLLSSGEMAEEF